MYKIQTYLHIFCLQSEVFISCPTNIGYIGRDTKHECNCFEIIDYYLRQVLNKFKEHPPNTHISEVIPTISLVHVDLILLHSVLLILGFYYFA